MKSSLLTPTEFFVATKQHFETKLQQLLSSDREQSRLTEAMQYSALNGGKRLRPLLVYATGTALGANLDTLDYPALAVELVHCYSLIHDDLPTMDDDALRRGKPTCHIAFDEATAILAGDALQSLAFEVLASKRATPNSNLQLEMIRILAYASGQAGMAGGQSKDLLGERQHLALQQLDEIHLQKTGALIRASIRLGALAAGCSDRALLSTLDQFARDIGLAFQMQDDILDCEGSTTTLGKPAGSDERQQKSTYPSLLGLSHTKEKLETLMRASIDTIKRLPIDTTYLEALAKQMIERDN